MRKTTENHAKVALITGAARRIGAAIAAILHEIGMNVVIHYHHSEVAANKLCALLNKKRAHSACAMPADLTELSAIKTLIQNTIKKWGRLDVLINNASCFFKTEIGAVSEASWNELMNTNLKAPFFLAQAAFPHLAKQLGCIINIADIHSKRPMRDYPVYCISKAGLIMLTKTLARELGPDVRVNSVSPGQILWPEVENALSNEIKQKIIHRTALQRHGDPQEIAKTILFLVKDADYITGQDIAVDGGRLLYI